MNALPHLALIIGSTRTSRFADKPADWLLDVASARDDLKLERLDLRDFDLPLFDEMSSNMYAPSQDPRVLAWQDAIRPFDGYVFTVAEYNHSITGALKNALDQAYVEWIRKPFAALSYGGNGGVRAVEHLRMIGVELQMAPVQATVAIGAGEFRRVHPMIGNEPISALDDVLRPTADTMLDELVWWTNALATARRAA